MTLQSLHKKQKIGNSYCMKGCGEGLFLRVGLYTERTEREKNWFSAKLGQWCAAVVVLGEYKLSSIIREDGEHLSQR